ncbi:MAG: OadG family protein [Oscillospiraceae bacterium]|nr:OadG family protein [Oscillospiraceae bacterium]
MNIALKMLLEGGEGAINRIQKQPDAASQLADPDYWGSVGILTLTGILVVFLILAILIFVFWLMGTIFKAVDKSKAEKKALEEAAKVEAPAPAPAPVVEAAAEVDDDEELVAVISAAIAAYEGDGGFTITSIRRRETSAGSSRSAWSLAGLNGNMRQF